jgi:nicotinate-nucleotide adenylyltransferase
MLRVGIFRGAFSPIHNGHVAAAKEFMRQMWIDVLFVIPTKNNEGGVSGADRLKMCELAFDGVDGVIVSDIEIRDRNEGGIVSTLRALSDSDRRLFLLCGTDEILRLDKTADIDEIFSLSYPTYIRRESDPVIDERMVRKETEYREKYGKNVVRINADVVELSSGRVRETVARGEDISSYVSPSVDAYIKEKGLYTI